MTEYTFHHRRYLVLSLLPQMLLVPFALLVLFQGLSIILFLVLVLVSSLLSQLGVIVYWRAFQQALLKWMNPDNELLLHQTLPAFILYLRPRRLLSSGGPQEFYNAVQALGQREGGEIKEHIERFVGNLKKRRIAQTAVGLVTVAILVLFFYRYGL